VDICVLALANALTLAGPALDTSQWSHFLTRIGELLAGYFDPGPANVVNLPVLLTGHDLMQALDLPPGPQIGVLLELIREAQAAGEITTRADALALARQHLA
jgi:poly(A) polymerase/tRNA nucleotidyltransferase (CCA-adding enzyme)